MSTKKNIEVPLTEKFTRKLAESNITPAQAKKLSYELLSAEATQKLGHRKVPCFKLPYFDAAGKPLKFYRIRYLEDTKKGFAKQTNAKNQRYDQPIGASPEVYLPTINKRKWLEEFKLESPLFITEGELKAACACIYGLPTLALGGVWNFCSRKNGVAILPIFKAMNLKGRNVYIVFDSDAITNPDVAAAENALCRELMALGAYPYIIRLPSLDGKKCGLDDYLVARGREEFDGLIEVATEYRLAAELHRMNEEVIYIENPSLVLRHTDGYKMGVRTFKQEVYANRTFIDFSGEKPKKVTTADEWVKWEGRSSVSGFVYAPGDELFVQNKLNLWKPLPYEPKKGDIAPWVKLLDHLFAGEPESRRWVEQWLAYPLQHLGEKLFTAVIMWGVQTGTGKTLVGHTMQRLYGDNSIMVRKKDLKSGDNSFAENKQFVLGEEITGDERREMVDDLKSLITNEELRINIKYVPQFTIRSPANYYFTSNNPDAFYVDETDRRFFIHEVAGEGLPEAWYSDVYDPWYKSDAGAAALLHHLMTLDLTGFKPKGRPPTTKAKEEMIENSRSVLANWVHHLRDTPDKVLKVGNATIDYALYTTEDLLKIFDPEDKKRVGVRGMGVELKRARVVKAARGVGCRTSYGQCRLWAVRNPTEYLDMNPKLVGAAYDKERDGSAKEPKFSKKGRAK